MGGAVTVLERDTNIPVEIREKYERNLELKKRIAEKDAKYLRHHLMQTWKPHKDIIQILTERTKYQLELITYIFGRKKDIGGYETSLEDDLSALGETYGMFLRLLVSREFAIDAEMLDSVLGSLGCDECVVADVLGVCTDLELHAILSYHKKWKEIDLLPRITKKTIWGSPFQKVVIKMLDSGHRSTVVDSSLAADQAQQLFASGLGNPEVSKNDDEIFNILCLISREQCGLINEFYESLYDMNLQQAIVQTFRGSVSRALVLWTAPTHIHAVAKRFRFVFQDRVCDKVNLVHLVAKYDRNTMIDVMNMYDDLYAEDLEERLVAKVSGNLRLAIEGWLNNHTCDRDHENAVRECMVQYETDMSLLQDETFMAKLDKHMEGEYSVLLKYIEDHKVDKGNTAVGIPKNTAKELDSDKAMARIVNVKLVKKFLKDRLEQEDLDGSGSLDPTEFWTALSHMELGYSDAEIEEIRNWIDKDKDGHIVYKEVITELANSIVDTIEDKLGMDVATKIKEMRARCEAIDAELLSQWNASHGVEGGSETSPSAEDNKLAPNIIQYLHDTFDEVDADKSGSLDSTEFWNILVSVLQLTEGDKSILEMEWDDNKDGLISWAEAVEEFQKIFQTMKDEKRDHWIGLLDKPSGKMFWYNLKDDSSFWMSDEEQTRFQSLVAQGASREEKLEPSNIPLQASNKKKSAKDIKILMKNEKTANNTATETIATTSS